MSPLSYSTLRQLLESFDSDLNEALDVIATEAALLAWRLALPSDDDDNAVDQVEVAAKFETFIREKEQSLGAARMTRLIIPPPYALIAVKDAQKWAADVAGRIEHERRLVERKQLLLIALASSAISALGVLLAGIGIVLSALLRH